MGRARGEGTAFFGRGFFARRVEDRANKIFAALMDGNARRSGESFIRRDGMSVGGNGR